MIDEEEMMLTGSNMGQQLFKDKDYDEKNQTLNRVKQFTFIKL
jgi:hypothetical protein